MAFALVVGTAVGANSNPTTPSIDTTGANLIIIGVSGWTGSFPAPADSKGNSWTALTQRSYGDSIVCLYYCYAPTVGSGHTFSMSGTVYASIMVLAFSGAASSPFDAENGNGNGSTPVNTLAAGSITPSEDNELVVAVWGSSNFDSPSVDSGFTLSQVNAGTGLPYHGGLAYKIQTTAATVNPTASWTSAQWASAGIACFKASAAAVKPFIPAFVMRGSV